MTRDVEERDPLEWNPHQFKERTSHQEGENYDRISGHEILKKDSEEDQSRSIINAGKTPQVLQTETEQKAMKTAELS